MTTRDRAPIGAPCWTDLWTSDVDGSRKFYGELLGWEADEPNPEFGGYFMFTRSGVPVAGGFSDMGDMAADNTWKIYLSTEDITKAIEAAGTAGAEIVSPTIAVADLGIQSVLVDPTGRVPWRVAAGDLSRIHRLERARCSELVRVVHPRPRNRGRLLPLSVPLGDRYSQRQRRVSLHDDA